MLNSSRRGLPGSRGLLGALVAVSGALSLAIVSNVSGGPHNAGGLSGPQALQMLLDGNIRSFSRPRMARRGQRAPFVSTLKASISDKQVTV